MKTGEIVEAFFNRFGYVPLCNDSLIGAMHRETGSLEETLTRIERCSVQRISLGWLNHAALHRLRTAGFSVLEGPTKRDRVECFLEAKSQSQVLEAEAAARAVKALVQPCTECDFCQQYGTGACVACGNLGEVACASR